MGAAAPFWRTSELPMWYAPWHLKRCWYDAPSRMEDDVGGFYVRRPRKSRQWAGAIIWAFPFHDRAYRHQQSGNSCRARCILMRGGSKSFCACWYFNFTVAAAEGSSSVNGFAIRRTVILQMMRFSFCILLVYRWVSRTTSLKPTQWQATFVGR